MQKLALPHVIDRRTDRIRTIASAMAQQETRLLEAIAEAREAGQSWDAIGRALGISRQAAWQRFDRAVDAALRDKEGIATADPDLSEIRRRLVDALRPSRLVLFGSRARGDAKGDSDLDVLAVLPEVENRHRSTVLALRSLKDVGQDVDILVASEEEAATTGRVPGTVLNMALTEGRVFYDRAS